MGVPPDAHLCMHTQTYYNIHVNKLQMPNMFIMINVCAHACACAYAHA